MAGAARPPTQGRSRPGFGGERGETRVDKNQHSFERMFKRQCARACPGVLGYTGTYQAVMWNSKYSPFKCLGSSQNGPGAGRLIGPYRYTIKSQSSSFPSRCFGKFFGKFLATLKYRPFSFPRSLPHAREPYSCAPCRCTSGSASF